MLGGLRGQLIVSCQASEKDAFYSPESMARFAKAARDGGAAGIRANSPADIRAIRNAVSLPIIGIQKVIMEDDGKVLITPTLDDAVKLVEAGAAAVALDCTRRGQRYAALERIPRMKKKLGVPILADIATEEEAKAAAAAGADYVLSTMRGYTSDTAQIRCFEPEFIARLVSVLNIPVIAEGQIHSPEEARAALLAGAYAVIVGTAITRPQEVTRRFVHTMHPEASKQHVIAIDLGATNTKSAVANSSGSLTCSAVIPTPAQATQLDLMQHLHNQVRRAMLDSNVKVGSIGIATAGWVDPHTGGVVHATANLPTWSGAPIARTLRDTFQIPVFVENDANAFALAEGLFGAARGVQNYFTVTLGTGVGGGVVMNGRLLRGAHNLGNALGHICIEPDGLLCTCGQKGCLEAYCNLAALARYNGSLEPLADSLARGLASLIHAYDPELIVIAGGIAQSNPKLIALLEARLAQLVFAWEKRHVRIAGSTLGYEAGVLGAAALCFQD